MTLRRLTTRRQRALKHHTRNPLPATPRPLNQRLRLNLLLPALRSPHQAPRSRHPLHHQRPSLPLHPLRQFRQ